MASAILPVARFHAAVFSEDDNPSFALLDERFEDVPQGGPI